MGQGVPVVTHSGQGLWNRELLSLHIQDGVCGTKNAYRRTFRVGRRLAPVESPPKHDWVSTDPKQKSFSQRTEGSRVTLTQTCTSVRHGVSDRRFVMFTPESKHSQRRETLVPTTLEGYSFLAPTWILSDIRRARSQTRNQKSQTPKSNFCPCPVDGVVTDTAHYTRDSHRKDGCDHVMSQDRTGTVGEPFPDPRPHSLLRHQHDSGPGVYTLRAPLSVFE